MKKKSFNFKLLPSQKIKIHAYFTNTGFLWKNPQKWILLRQIFPCKQRILLSLETADKWMR